MGFFSSLGLGGGGSDVPVEGSVAKRGFGRQLKDELLGREGGPTEPDPYAGKNPFSRFGSQLKDELTGEDVRRKARTAQLTKMLGGPFTMERPMPTAQPMPTAFDLSQRNRT